MKPVKLLVVALFAVSGGVQGLDDSLRGDNGTLLAFRASMSTAAAQDPAAVEASLGLDRLTRRVIQQGLGHEGFDPGAPDGLFGPRTRAAIRGWQEARGEPATGYLDGVQAELLRAAVAPRQSMSVNTATSATQTVQVVGSPDAPEPQIGTAVQPPAANMVTASAVAEVSEAEPLQAADPSPSSAAAASTAAAAAVGEALAAPAAAVLSPGGNAPAAPALRNTLLPPEILVDRRLVRVERLLAEDDHWPALQVMNEILSLQRQHALALPAEFHFKYAQVAFAAGRAETAVASVNEYLLAAGRNGEFYRDALELLDSAEETVRRTEVDRRRAEAARHRAEALQRENDDLARRQAEAASVPLSRDSLRSGGLAPEMVTLAAGRFQYFSSQRGPRRTHLEWVTFDRPFAIGKYEVTRGEFERFVDHARYRTEARRDPEYGCNAPRTDNGRRNSGLRWNRPRFDQTGRHPVTCVSIRDAIAYARWLSQETGQRYRLPSAAEWQYAERAGSPAAMLHSSSHYQVAPDVCRYAHRAVCFRDNSLWADGYTVEVGSLAGNGIGLHDMIGNVEELLLACRHPDSRYGDDDVGVLTPHGSRENPEDCAAHVHTTGGSWYNRYLNSFLRVAPGRRTRRYHPDAPPSTTYYRNSRTWTGFRLVRELPDGVR